MKKIKTAEEILSELALPFKPTECNFRLPVIIQAMQTYAQQFKPEWTAVEDGLPIEHRKIIFLTDNVLFPDNSYTGTYSQGNWHVSGNYRPVEAKVTHWMYIPNPKQ